MMIRESILIIFVLFFASCSKYERQDGCHLDKLNFKGNVVKVETIVQSTIPLTEMFYDVFGANAICVAGGNTVIEFDRHGFVQKYEGYGLDGVQIFAEKNIPIDTTTSIGPTVLGANLGERIGRVNITRKEDGRVAEAYYYSDEELVWVQKANYNKNGDISRITKNYVSLSYHSDLLNIECNDTTEYHYLSYDSHDNWTEAEVIYHGVLPKHNHTYKVKRQITYDEESKKSPLLEQLDEYNKVELVKADDSIHRQTVFLGEYGRITLPSYMRPVTNQRALAAQGMINLCVYEYGGSDAYASYSVSVIPGSYPFEDMTAGDFSYFKDIDEQYKDQMAQALAQGGVYLFKWIPYEYTKICGYQALRLRYYRYGMGSPIPVYVETYSIGAPYGEMTVTFSYQSNHAMRFAKSFQETLMSLSMNI